MQPAIIVTRIFEGPEAVLRLAGTGIGADDLREVVLSGEFARAEATQNDPVTSSGTDAYRYRVRSFRDAHVVKKGWRIVRQNGLEITQSADGSVSVITRAGNDAVGLRGSFPQPKRPVGSGTQDVIETKNLMLDANWMNVAQQSSPSINIWMLLVARTGDVARYELSLPSGVDDDGRVLGWVERILGEEIDLSDPNKRAAPEEPVAVDVPVKKKR